MGFGLPSALGAACAFDGRNGRPSKVVVDIDGDGSFLMNVQELATAFVDGLDVKVFILNNQHLGMVVQWEDRFYKVTYTAACISCSDCLLRTLGCGFVEKHQPIFHVPPISHVV